MTISLPSSEAIRPQFDFLAVASNPSGTPVSEDWNDGVFDVQTADYNDWIFVNKEPTTLPAATFDNKSPDICEVSGNDLTRLANGMATVVVSNSRSSQRVHLSFINEANDLRVPTGFVAGTYGKYSWDILKAKMDASTDLQIYTGSSASPINGIKNSGCWAAAYDFSGCVAGLKSGSIWIKPRGGAELTPQHFIATWHWPYAVGDIIRFPIGGGSFVERQIIGRSYDDRGGPNPAYVVSENPVIGDKVIYALSEATGPAQGVANYPIFETIGYTTGASTGANQVESAFAACGIHLNQFGQACASLNLSRRWQNRIIHPTTALWEMSASNFPGGNEHAGSVETNGLFAPYWGDFCRANIPGDSGSPFFLPLSGTELAFWTCFQSPSHGPSSTAAVLNRLIVNANDNAVANGHARPTDYTVTVAPDPTL